MRHAAMAQPLRPAGQLEPLLAVGTAEVLGEDSPCTGRVLLFEVGRPEGATAESDEWQATRKYSRSGPPTAGLCCPRAVHETVYHPLVSAMYCMAAAANSDMVKAMHRCLHWAGFSSQLLTACYGCSFLSWPVPAGAVVTRCLQQTGASCFFAGASVSAIDSQHHQRCEHANRTWSGAAHFSNRFHWHRSRASLHMRLLNADGCLQSYWHQATALRLLARGDLLYLTCRMFRGPVMKLSTIEGHLVVAAGNRLETHSWTGSGLQTAAFYDAPMLITSLNVVKSYILFGDVQKGSFFVRWGAVRLAQHCGREHPSHSRACPQPPAVALQVQQPGQAAEPAVQGL